MTQKSKSFITQLSQTIFLIKLKIKKNYFIKFIFNQIKKV